jgi:hypothetical protein
MIQAPGPSPLFGLHSKGSPVAQTNFRPRAYSMKHYKCVMRGSRGKLVCFSEPVEGTDNRSKTLAYYRICPFTENYEPVMFYRTRPKGKLGSPQQSSIFHSRKKFYSTGPWTWAVINRCLGSIS